MRSITCEILFPYNRAEEFYCGENLHLCIQLKCHKPVTVCGIFLEISCSTQENVNSNEYGRYIDEEGSSTAQDNKTIVRKTEIKLWGENAKEIVDLIPGTFIYDVECRLPESIMERSCDPVDSVVKELDYTFKVRIRKYKIDSNSENGTSQIVTHQAMALCRKRLVNFVWPAEFNQISNFNQTLARVSCDFIDILDYESNKFRHEDDDDETEYTLENWLDSVLEHPPPEDEDEEEVVNPENSAKDQNDHECEKSTDSNIVENVGNESDDKSTENQTIEN
ncbi:uncharacterized protein LOC129758229 [Uranotaenia lowii]|uniref:uncharacterized protein LOC129758229 n=1 Tax=Uranotaenia lowii TaxID=190385 RepID=UPI0024792869|nr:uncharacterized protein LOC129758229 [Uranotaenia lowii]